MGSHLSIFDHLEETSPDQSSTQDICNRVDVLDKEVERSLVDNIFSEGVILEV
jgi:hypothetical protein